MSVMFIILWQDGHPGAHQVPVKVELAQFSGFENLQFENVSFTISENVSSSAIITGNSKEAWRPALGFFLITVFKHIILIAILFLLSKILKTVIDNEPFAEKNSTYLFAIGWVLLLTPSVFFLFNYFAQSYFAKIPFPEGARIISLDIIDPNFLFAGIFMMVLGYVFREGNQLYEEQKLTV